MGWSRPRRSRTRRRGAAGRLCRDPRAPLPRTIVRITATRSAPTVAAFDATFCAPKSVSVLHGLGSSEVRAAIREAHDAAVNTQRTHGRRSCWLATPVSSRRSRLAERSSGWEHASGMWRWWRTVASTTHGSAPPSPGFVRGTLIRSSMSTSNTGASPIATDAADTRRRMVKEWMAARGAQTAVMLASRVDDVERLNDLARAQLAESGVIAGDEIVLGGRGFATGDLVLALRIGADVGL